ncbi:MAG: FMN-binding protein, partial [Verrucomicrobiota bacterium]|nr:FMN-binding protein [Verrucomicrobiota bacterium]
QFIGKNAAAKLDLNDGIHNISGATLSCRGITRGVKRVCHTWDVVLRPALVAGGALSKRPAKD